MSGKNNGNEPAIIRVLNVIYDDIKNPWLGGGGVVRAYEIYKRFPENVKVTLLTGRYPGAKREERVSGNFICRRIGLPWSYAVSRITFALSVPFYLLKHKDYDIVIDDHSAFSPTFSFFYTKRPVIGNFQNLHSQKSAKGKGILKAFFAEIFDRIAMRRFKYYTTLSPSFVTLIKEKARHKEWVRLVAMGVNEEFFKVRKKEKGYILFIGRIEIYQKGIDVLLKAYTTLQNRPKLVIAGGGVDEERVRQLVEKLNLREAVEFTGRYSHRQVLELLEGAVCTVMPSRFESFGLTALEAMASGTALIASRIPSVQDVVGDCAALVEPENPQELAQAMERVTGDTAFRKSLEEKGKARAKIFTWEQVAKDSQDAIADALSDYR